MKILMSEYIREGKVFFALEPNGNRLYVQKGMMKYVFFEPLIDAEWAYNICLKPGIQLLTRLYRRAVLHGSAFVANDRAFLIIAPSGTGKSTLCAAMNIIAKTYTISDDLLVISDDLYLYTGIQASYLNEDSYNIIAANGKKSTDIIHIHDEKAKIHPRLYDIDSIKYKYKIGGIILLNKMSSSDSDNGKVIKISKSSQMDSFIYLTKNIKFPEIIKANGIECELETIYKLVQQVPVISVSLKQDYDSLSEQVERLFHYISELPLGSC